jgi:uroporphyrinogen-III synthase
MAVWAEMTGVTVGVTSPPGMEALPRMLEERGATVVCTPLAEEVGVPGDDWAPEATAEVLAEPPDLVAVASGDCLGQWLEVERRHGLHGEVIAALHRAHVLAIGPAEASAAAIAGLDAAWIGPPSDPGALHRRLLAQRNHDATGRVLRLVVVADAEGSRELVEATRSHGYRVLVTRARCWTPAGEAEQATAFVTDAARRRLDAVTFTSRPAVEQFFGLAAQAGVDGALRAALTSGDLVVVADGPLTAESLREHGARFALEPDLPGIPGMVEALVATVAVRGRRIQLAGRDIVLRGTTLQLPGGDAATLTEREHAVLLALLERRGRVVSKRDLLTRVWGDTADDHVVEVAIGRLRRRLGPAGEGIQTVVRRGYRLTADVP